MLRKHPPFSGTRFVEQAGEAVIDGRARDGVGAVDAAGDLVGAVAEVDVDAVACDADRGADRDGAAAGAVVVHDVFEAVFAVGDRGDRAGHEGLRSSRAARGRSRSTSVGAVAGDHAAERDGADVVGGELGFEVAEALVGGAHGGEDAVEDVVLVRARRRTMQQRRLDADALLVDVAAEGHRARASSPPTSAWWARLAA